MSQSKGRRRPVDSNVDDDSRRHAMEDATPQGRSPIEEMGGTASETKKKASKRGTGNQTA
jgi:hypothetical protein